ncbi:MAG: IS110 family transposase [Candidatus Pacebacteria bacterium]|nr:IS110 family transposase [Candidatus Paceibacterota bacterium]
MIQNTKLLIGIDISKDKNDVCIKTNVGNASNYLRISNTKADLNKLYGKINEIKSQYHGNCDVIFGMEATGIYYLPLYIALKRDGHQIKLYNPIQTNGYRKMEIRKTKTDQKDASIIADMLRYSEPPVNDFNDLNLYQLRELTRTRQRIVDKRTRCKIQIIRDLDIIWAGYKKIIPMVFGKTSISILKKYTVPSKVTGKSFEEFHKFIKKNSRSQITESKSMDIYENAKNILSIPELETGISIEIKMLIAQIELSDKQIQFVEGKINKIMDKIDFKITSIPGIGGTLGAIILGEIGDIDRFSNVKKLVAFAGLDPVVNQSGKKENYSGPISKRGSPLLRHALFMAASTARQNDENIMRFYNKKMNEGKHYYSALNATAAKMLRIVYSVLKNNQEYKLQMA